MRFSSVIVGLFVCSFICKLQICFSENAEVHQTEHIEIPLIAPSPLGPLLSIGLNLIHWSYRYMGGNLPENISAETSETVPSMSLKEWEELNKTLVEDSLRAVKYLTSSYYVSRVIRDVSKNLANMSMESSKISDCVFNDTCSSYQINNILGSSSNYKYIVDSFVNASSLHWFDTSFEELVPGKLSSEQAAEWERQEKKKCLYCELESANTKALKFYMLIAKILTDACSHIQVSHVIRHQKFIIKNDLQNAKLSVKESMKITQEYLSNMKRLISTTRKMLKSSIGTDRWFPWYTVSGSFRDCDDSFRVEHRILEFSLKSVDAPPGYVVTGMRWRMLNDIMYIQIQVGKFIDGIRVDRSTVKWLDIVESDELIDFDIDDMNFCEGKLEPGKYVTGIQMISTNEKLQFSMKTSEANQHGTKLSGPVQHIIKHDFAGIQYHRRHFRNIFFEGRDIITEPSAPIGGFGMWTEETLILARFIVKLKIYGPDYTNMMDQERFDKYAKLFEFESNSN